MHVTGTLGNSEQQQIQFSFQVYIATYGDSISLVHRNSGHFELLGPNLKKLEKQKYIEIIRWNKLFNIQFMQCCI